MSIVAQEYDHVIGVDTHARTDTFAVVDARTGSLLNVDVFPTSPPGLKRGLTWSRRHATGRVLLVIEGAGSYGASLARLANTNGWTIVEPADMPARGGQGKSDPVDAARIARSVLSVDTTRLRQPRADQGIREALRILIDARDTINQERTAMINTLTALVRTTDLDIDARRRLTKQQITTIAAWRTRTEPIEKHHARTEATRLAKRIHTCNQELADNEAELTALVQASPAAPLLNLTGIGPVCAATILVTWSHPGRIHSEAAFAAIAGANPIPASSGNTTRYRLNHGGDRRLNRALTTIANTRLAHDQATKTYLAKRTTQGMTPRDTKRILKRYIARHIYRILEHPTPQPTT